ncbi:MAG: metal ABC transporter substrate-binding protein [Oscillospiraceae bacterium]|jgi:zinc transport system substrate-binding protein|nr:metal ABC transporter substrate-binding protein [Oscillospiraceae bacterium]
MKLINIKLTALLAVISLLTACGIADTPTISDSKVNIITTIFPPYDFSREIAGGYADITMLLPPAAESHSFEPTPRDIIKIQNADIFIYVGGESDTWVDGVLESLNAPNLRVVTLMDCVEVVAEEYSEGMELEEEEEEEAYDEHVWTSPRNAKLIAEKIAASVIEADPNNRQVYEANLLRFSAELDNLDERFRQTVANGSRDEIIFGDRFPFRYFADAYGLTYYAAFPGCSGETEPSASTVAFLIDKIKADDIPVVFHIELGNERMANVIADATGAKSLTLHSCHNISKTDFQNGKTYLDFMRENVEALKEALA